MPLEAGDWQLDVVVSAPHKCLGGPSGMSLVSVSDQAWDVIEHNPAAPRGSYLSLLDWRERWHGKEQFPYTPFAAAIQALAAACEQALEEGLDACIARHAAAARACRAGAAAMGLALWPDSPAAAADCVTGHRGPRRAGHEAVRLQMRDRYGVATSPDAGVGNLIRIAHMGPGRIRPVPGHRADGARPGAGRPRRRRATSGTGSRRPWTRSPPTRPHRRHRRPPRGGPAGFGRRGFPAPGAAGHRASHDRPAILVTITGSVPRSPQLTRLLQAAAAGDAGRCGPRTRPRRRHRRGGRLAAPQRRRRGLRRRGRPAILHGRPAARLRRPAVPVPARRPGRRRRRAAGRPAT